MRGLLVKDFRQLLQQKKSLLMILMLALVLGINMDGNFSFGYLTFIGAFLVLNTLSYDEYDNTLPFLFTLPVKRTTYAVEKYVFGLCICTMGWGTALLLNIGKTLAGSGMEPDELLHVAPVYIPIFLVMIALMIPFPLIFGREKGSIVLMIVIGIVVAAFYFVDKILTRNGISIVKWMNSMSELSYGTLLLSLAVFGVVLILISCFISAEFMKKKEF